MAKKERSYEEIYADIKAATDPNDVYAASADPDYQKLSKKKNIVVFERIIALITAGAVVIGGGIAGLVNAFAKNSDGKDKDKSSVSDSDNKYDDYDFVLEHATDVDNAKQLENLVDAVNENSKKDSKVSANISENMVKFYNGNGRLKKNAFKNMSDADIVKELRSYAVDLDDVLSTAITDTQRLDEGATKDLPSALAVALTIMDKDDYLYKHYLVKYDTEILKKHMMDIANGNKAAYEENAEAFFKIIKEMLNDSKVNIYQKAFIAKMGKAHMPIFAKYLSPEQLTYFEKEFDDTYFVVAYNTLLQEFVIDSDVLDDDCGEKTTTGTYTGGKNKPTDSDKYAGETTTVHELVEQGGGKAKGSKGKQETVKEATTSAPVTSEEIVDIPEDEKNKPTEVEKGGKPVEDSTKKPGTEQGGKPAGDSDTIVSGGEIIEEEDVPPGEEETPIDEEIIVSEEEHTTVANISSPQEDAVTEDDVVSPGYEDDDVIILTEEEFKNYSDADNEWIEEYNTQEAVSYGLKF